MKRKLLTSVGCVSMIAILFLIYNVNFSGGGDFFKPKDNKIKKNWIKNKKKMKFILIIIGILF